jgi:hypothetical protein
MTASLTAFDEMARAGVGGYRVDVQSAAVARRSLVGSLGAPFELVANWGGRKPFDWQPDAVRAVALD